jgi:Protein of unknown function (DUF1566)
MLLVTVVLILGAATMAPASPEERCQANLYFAAGNYARCQQKAAAKYYANGGVDVPKYQDAARKCAEGNATMWRRLQARANGTGSTCDGARLIDNGDGTVTDRLSGLQWEKKTDDATVHDKDDRYPWSATGTAADGTTFTTFLATLNAACFAGQCDWRLPTLPELQTILLAQYPDGGIDPIFGPGGDYYWSATRETGKPEVGWVLSFQDGSRTTGAKSATFNVRAVRGGL